MIEKSEEAKNKIHDDIKDKIVDDFIILDLRVGGKDLNRIKIITEADSYLPKQR